MNHPKGTKKSNHPCGNANVAASTALSIAHDKATARTACVLAARTSPACPTTYVSAVSGAT